MAHHSVAVYCDDANPPAIFPPTLIPHLLQDAVGTTDQGA